MSRERKRDVCIWIWGRDELDCREKEYNKIKRACNFRVTDLRRGELTGEGEAYDGVTMRS